MIHTMLNTRPEEFIPFFAIFFVFIIPVLAIYFYYQHKKRVMDERRLMIEKGITPPPLKESVDDYRSKSSLSKGFNMVAIALGLLIGYFISIHYHIKGPFGILGAILFFLGVANILSAFFVEKHQDQLDQQDGNKSNSLQNKNHAE